MINLLLLFLFVASTSLGVTGHEAGNEKARRIKELLGR